MDLIKIGKYIAGKRKDLGLTQKQLAEKLGMSDKSVSKWERGICLPDVSVYSDLCQNLGISINEFFAGEDIPQENIVVKSEANIIEVARDSKQKQKRSNRIICVLLIISILTLSVIAVFTYRANRPRNVIEPLSPSSIEMKTAELLSGSDSVHIYKFTTTSEFRSLKLYISEYHSGELIDKQTLEIGYEDLGSPENGTILIIPDFSTFQVKTIIADEGSKLSTAIPILTDVPEREYYGRSSTRIDGETQILFDIEQPLVGLIYDNDEMWVLDIYDLLRGDTDALRNDDYVYLFSYEFCKE